MPEDSQAHIVYASFDRFPSPKGAATHIDAFVRALGERFGQVSLLTIPSETAELTGEGIPGFPELSAPPDRTRVDWTPEPHWEAEGVIHQPLPAPGVNLFERVLSFRSHLWHWWQSRFRDEPVSVVHFRSIFEGYPIARQKERFCRRLVYEVNGLPSIELKYRYPRVADDSELQRKLLQQEQVCLEAADLIITVSNVNAEHLVTRGVPPERICVIRNGVNLDQYAGPDPAIMPDTYPDARPLQILYAGTMSAWQGVHYAIESLALLRRDHDAILILVGPARPRQIRELKNQIYEHRLTDHVRILEPVSKRALAELHHLSDVVLAPLTRNDRNLVQGCCPLKILEAMASGTPLVASDLPVVRELATNDVEALLVRPGSAKAINDAMLRLISDEGLGARLSQAARARAEQEFGWKRSRLELIAAYEWLLDERDTSRLNSFSSRRASASF